MHASLAHPILVIGAFHETLELCQAADAYVAGIVDNEITGEYRGVPIAGKP